MLFRKQVGLLLWEVQTIVVSVHPKWSMTAILRENYNVFEVIFWSEMMSNGK